MKVLRKLARDLHRRVEVHTFGCTEASLADTGLPTDFPFIHHGILTREQVAQVLREADVFLDLSDYQAFGRTGLEAMACGCAAALPAKGGASEYAVNGVNALVVDTCRLAACHEAARELVIDATLRQRLRAAALATAAAFSIECAARAQRDLFLSAWLARRDQHQPPDLAAADLAAPGNGAPDGATLSLLESWDLAHEAATLALPRP
jgi:glycosyltransferase involved in cell wall biosynthesis